MYLCFSMQSSHRGWCFVQPQPEPEKEPQEVSPQDLAYLGELAGRTEQLWAALSATIAAVEADVAKTQVNVAEGASGARMLPPGVLQVRILAHSSPAAPCVLQ